MDHTEPTQGWKAQHGSEKELSMDLTKSQIRKADRETLLRYATYECLPTVECSTTAEIDAMSLTALRRSILGDLEWAEIMEERG